MGRKAAFFLLDGLRDRRGGVVFETIRKRRSDESISLASAPGAGFQHAQERRVLGRWIVATMERFAGGTDLRRCDEHYENLDATTDNFVLVW